MSAKIYYFPIKQQEPMKESAPVVISMASCAAHPLTAEENIREKFPQSRRRPWDPSWGGPCPWEKVPAKEEVRPRMKSEDIRPQRPWYEGVMDGVVASIIFVAILELLATVLHHMMIAYRP